jgi:hypothetical protein
MSFNNLMKNNSGEGVLYGKPYVLSNPHNISKGSALKRLMSHAGTRKVLDMINDKNPGDLNLYEEKNYKIIKNAVWSKNRILYSVLLAFLCVTCIALIIWQVKTNSNMLIIGLASGVLGTSIYLYLSYMYFKYHIISEYENL